MFNKIVLAGGSGYLGQVLADFYKDLSKEILILGRKPHPSSGNIRYAVWDARTEEAWTELLEGSDLLINLTGKNVNCRYTKKNRQEIIRSRTESTFLLGSVISHLASPPKVWINIASATIYRHAEDHWQDEESGEEGSGFSVEVCRAWEKIFWEASTPKTNKIILRTAIVFGRKDGVVPRLVNLVKTGIGGRQGNGRQYISWVHEQDFARITAWIFKNAKDGEIYNAASPVAIQNKDLMKLMRKAMHISIGFPTPEWLLKIGALIIGTETELVLKSRWVYPRHLLEKGFRFNFPNAEQALDDILRHKP